MPRPRTPRVETSAAQSEDAFQYRTPAATPLSERPDSHVYGKGFVCDTDSRGHATSRGLSPLEIVVDASEGFIPLWEKDTTLRWRFRDTSFASFRNPVKAKSAVRELLGKALLAWGDAAPVKFTERKDAYDFEIVISRSDQCDVNGCVLASAFFPDAGRHSLKLYPKLFAQSKQEQIETLVHELGHVFGLRHFFADVSERAWPSEVFGAHKPFSIMNYGHKSVLTADDTADLKRLYQLVWAGELKQINGTPIRLVRPFHAAGSTPMLRLGTP